MKRYPFLRRTSTGDVFVILDSMGARRVPEDHLDLLLEAGIRWEPPTVVCLCGSTRFADLWKQSYRAESLAGRIVLSVGVMVHAGDEPIRDDGPEKRLLDELNLRKIDLADEVLVLDHDGYIGESTKHEIAYAERLDKTIRYWSREQ